MPIETSFVNDGRGFLLSGRSIVEGREILSLKQSLLEDPDRVNGVLYWLVDFSDVSELRMSTAELSQVLEIDRQLAIARPNSIVAVVAAADSVYGFARMWETKAESVGWTTSVFRDVADAKLWIQSRLSGSQRSHPDLSIINSR